MATYFEDLTKAFDSALVSFCQVNNVGVALESAGWNTDIKDPYLAGYMLLAPTEQADLFWTERRAGVYQIDINYEKMKGSAVVNKMADLLNEAFKAGSNFVRNDICAEVQSIDLGPLIVENGWAKRPLSVNFVAYTKRL